MNFMPLQIIAIQLGKKNSIKGRLYMELMS